MCGSWLVTGRKRIRNVMLTFCRSVVVGKHNRRQVNCNRMIIDRCIRSNGLKVTFAASDDRHVAWTGAAIKDDRFLHPRNDKVRSLTGNGLLDPPDPVKYDSPVPCINCGDRKCVNFSHRLTLLQAWLPVSLYININLFTHQLINHKVKHMFWVDQLTIVQCRVYNATTNGEGQTQLPNGLKKLSHDGNLRVTQTQKTRPEVIVSQLYKNDNFSFRKPAKKK